MAEVLSASRPTLQTVLAEIRALLPEGCLSEDWYCPTCKAHLSGAQVTPNETHEVCGTYLDYPVLDLSKCPTLLEALKKPELPKSAWQYRIDHKALRDDKETFDLLRGRGILRWIGGENEEEGSNAAK